MIFDRSLVGPTFLADLERGLSSSGIVEDSHYDTYRRLSDTREKGQSNHFDLSKFLSFKV